MKGKNMQVRFVILVALIISLLAGCQSDDAPKAETAGQIIGHKIEVKEVIQSASYTYLRVEENGNEYWIATGKRDFDEGATLYYDQGLEMKNFKSKGLDRTFDSLLMVQNVSSQPLTMPKEMSGMQGQKPKLKKEAISVKLPEGGVSIGEIYADMESFANKTIVVRGKVTKFNGGIMNRNWVHIQDGTGGEDSYDLTITTNEIVKVGSEITFKGKISINKDFGAGYSYKVIMEEASQQ